MTARMRVLISVVGFFSAQAGWAVHPALETALARISQDRAEGRTSFVVSDLDETLVDSTERRFYALRKATVEHCLGTTDGWCGSLFGINLSEVLGLPNRYDLIPLFEQLGINSRFYSPIWSRTLEIYLSNEFMGLDQSIPGAIEFTQKLRAAGAVMFYVSSRWNSKQRAGTWKNLLELGFVLRGEEDRVYLRKDGQSSIDFKREAFEQIDQLGKKKGALIRLAMENEPENFNALVDRFAGADHVFVEGAWMKQEPLKGNPIRVRDFR
ncbi:MAG: HAD family acid phosphatase [Bdellovibrionota bacterium]